ncbi:radical SAM protein [Patescibacteria group bacterium]
MTQEFRVFWYYTIGKYLYQMPPILTLFVTNRCNGRCLHCFYWQNLALKKTDLAIGDLRKLSQDLGHLELLLLSGGEPFLRDDLAQVCKVFFDSNGLRTVSIPTNGLLPKKIIRETEKILKACPGLRVTVPLSLDGTKKVHDQIRGVKGAFEKVQGTSRRLVELAKQYPNLRVRLTATVFNLNYENLFKLIDQLPQLFPNSEDFWDLSLNFLRGETRQPGLSLPSVKKLERLFAYKLKKFKGKRSWTGALLEKVVFKATVKTLKEKKQVVPCEAGRLLGVVYEDGSVGHCELLPTLGNLKREGFDQVWSSKKAKMARKEIVNKACFCTHGCNLFPSLIAHPLIWLGLVF